VRGDFVTTEVRIVDAATGGMKGRKAERWDLFPFDALDEVARVYSAGAAKYDDHNWVRGYAWSLSLGALLRHVSLFAQGQDRDPETGCLHLASAAWHCLALMTFYFRGLGTDDRKPASVHPEALEPEPMTLDAAASAIGDPWVCEDIDTPVPYAVRWPDMEETRMATDEDFGCARTQRSGAV
jgi:hypothetical protein